jgi:hypothetical protein
MTKIFFLPRIYNPLAGLSKTQLFINVTHFCEAYGLEDKIDTFKKAALLAQSPLNFESIDELDEEDKYYLRRETTRKLLVGCCGHCETDIHADRWHLPKALYFSIALCSLGSAIQGWDNTGANGANLSYPQEFGIENNTWLVGVINAG